MERKTIYANGMFFKEKIHIYSFKNVSTWDEMMKSKIKPKLIEMGETKTSTKKHLTKTQMS